jgi:iron complex outermembrane receptor protein
VAAAQQEPRDTLPQDTVFKVEEIRVQVARPITTAGGAAAVREAPDSLNVPASPTLEEVLRETPLMLVRENSRGEAELSVRGAESRQVAVHVDGVPLTLGWDDRTDVSVIPAAAARQVTLVRGLSSVLYGPNTLGGVVLVSLGEGQQMSADVSPFQMSAGLDHRGNGAVTMGIGSLYRRPSGNLLFRVGGGYRDRSGWPRPDDVPEEVPDQGVERLNSDLWLASGFALARYEADDGRWLSLSSFGFWGEKGVPPEMHIAEPRLWRYPRQWRWVTALSAGTGWGGTPLGEGDLEASVGLDFGRTEIDTYDSFAYDSITGGEDGDDRTLTLRLLGDHTLGGGLLRSALTLAETRHVEVIDDGDPATYRQRLLGWGAEVEQPLLRGEGGATQARVAVGVNVDAADTPETGPAESRDPIWAWGARAGGTLVLGGGNVLLNGGLSRRVRFPSLRELYSGALGKYVVNPDLDPEALAVAELGITARARPYELQVVAFHQQLSDAIVRVSIGGGKFQRVNRDRIRSTGVELLASYSWRGISLGADGTFQDVQLEDPAAPAEQQHPEYQPWFFGSLGISAELPLELRGAARARHVAKRYCINPDLEAEVALDPDSWLDLELERGFRLGPGGRPMRALLAIDNLTDSAVYDQCGLPQPGRLVRIQIQVY